MVEKKNIKLTLKYDGRNYHGWQRQLNDISIQEVIEDKIQIMTREPVRLTASGRTDAGVHALEQVCNFFTLTNIPPDSMKNGLNSLLPDDIFIIEIDINNRNETRLNTHKFLSGLVSHNIILSVKDDGRSVYIFFDVYR